MVGKGFSWAFNDPTLADCTLRIQSRKDDAPTSAVNLQHRDFHAHRVVLANASPSFKTQAQQVPQGGLFILLVDAHLLDAVEALVKFIYQIPLQLKTADELANVLVVANTYEVQDCVDTCKTLLSPNALNLNTIQQVLSTPGMQLLSFEKLTSAILTSMLKLESNWNNQQYRRCFRKLPVELLTKLLSNTDLECSSENTLLAAICSWREHNPDADEAYASLLRMLRPISFTGAYLSILLQASGPTAEQLHDQIHAALRVQLLPASRRQAALSSGTSTSNYLEAAAKPRPTIPAKRITFKLDVSYTKLKNLYADMHAPAPSPPSSGTTTETTTTATTNICSETNLPKPAVTSSSYLIPMCDSIFYNGFWWKMVFELVGPMSCPDVQLAVTCALPKGMCSLQASNTAFVDANIQVCAPSLSKSEFESFAKARPLTKAPELPTDTSFFNFSTLLRNQSFSETTTLSTSLPSRTGSAKDASSRSGTKDMVPASSENPNVIMEYNGLIQMGSDGKGTVKLVNRAGFSTPITSLLMSNPGLELVCVINKCE